MYKIWCPPEVVKNALLEARANTRGIGKQTGFHAALDKLESTSAGFTWIKSKDPNVEYVNKFFRIAGYQDEVDSTKLHELVHIHNINANTRNRICIA